MFEEVGSVLKRKDYTATTGLSLCEDNFIYLISKLNFYKLIPYPMDNCFTGRRDRSHQTPEKDVLYRIPAGPARRVHSPGGASYFLFLSRHRDVIASFLFGAWRVKTCFQRQGIFWFYTELNCFISSLK